jgi:adenylylsulfate kinase-like enzyme
MTLRRTHPVLTGSELLPVLWVCGPCGVGKTTVGWEIFSQLDSVGIRVGYVDIDQLGMCYPTPADDPHNHRVKVANVAAAVATFRAAGARCVVISGTVDVDRARTYADQIPGAALTFCRLSIDRDELRTRLAERGWDADLLAEAMQEAETLDISEFADVCVDTSGMSVPDVAQRVREEAGGWPMLLEQTVAVGNTAEASAPKADTTDTAAGPVLWLCGATGVGKSTIGFQIFLQVMGAGIAAAYVDLEQVGFLRPAPADDPDNHRVKVRNLSAIWQSYRASAARCLIVVGSVDDRDAVQMYGDSLPAGSLTTVRLHAGHDQLTERIMLRGQGDGGWRAPGDPLKGQSTATLNRIAAKAAANADELERAEIGDLRIDTDGRTIEEVTQLVRDKAGGWPI